MINSIIASPVAKGKSRQLSASKKADAWQPVDKQSTRVGERKLAHCHNPMRKVDETSSSYRISKRRIESPKGGQRSLPTILYGLTEVRSAKRDLRYFLVP
jgi:hypothetical protein